MSFKAWNFSPFVSNLFIYPLCIKCMSFPYIVYSVLEIFADIFNSYYGLGLVSGLLCTNYLENGDLHCGMSNQARLPSTPCSLQNPRNLADFMHSTHPVCSVLKLQIHLQRRFLCTVWWIQPPVTCFQKAVMKDIVC